MPYKVELCRHFARGFCQRGASCGFAHGPDDVRFPTPMLVRWELPCEFNMNPHDVWAFGFSVKHARDVLCDRLRTVAVDDEDDHDRQVVEHLNRKLKFPTDMYVFEGPYTYMSDDRSDDQPDGNKWLSDALEVVANKPPTTIQPCVAGVCSALDG